MAVGQKQIAEKLGVSIALVSRVLSGRALEIGISPATIERVMQTASEMGYVPNAAALGLKGKSTRTIGVAVYDFLDPYFGLLITEIQRHARIHDYSIVLAGFLNRIPDEQSLLPLKKHALDGMIVIGTDLESNWVDDFYSLPTVRIGHALATESSIGIYTDEEQSGKLLLEHLSERGATKPAFLGAALPAHRLRFEAFRTVAQRMGIDLSFHASDERDPYKAGAACAGEIMARQLDVDALVCATDQVASGALRPLLGNGIDIPNLMRVTGFDDIPLAARFLPSITTVRQPVVKMVNAAFDILLGKCEPTDNIVLATELVVRETT